MIIGFCFIPSINGEIKKLSMKLDNKNHKDIVQSKIFFSNPPKEEWNKTFGGEFFDDAAYDVQQTSDSGFIIVGLMDNQGCLIKTDSNGNEIWRKTPFINDFSFFCYPTFFQTGQQTTDGGFIIAGSTSGYYNGDVWLIKFGPESETPNVKFTIKGGLGVHVKITNNGTINYSDIAWQIHVKGGVFGFINYTVNGTVDIDIGELKTVGTKILLGLGSIQIIANVDEEAKTVSGTQFFIFTILKK